MQAIFNMLYVPGLPLKTMGIIIGLSLIVSHAFALAKPGVVQPWLKRLPRNGNWGSVLIIIAFAWAFMYWSCMDLGEFFKIEKPIQLVIVAVCVGVLIYVKEFLAVRALGFLMILAAAPILDSAFLKEPQSRLLIVAFAYAIAVNGMFYVGIPYLMRDQINWVLEKKLRYTVGFAAGLAFGVIVIVCALMFW